MWRFRPTSWNEPQSFAVGSGAARSPMILLIRRTENIQSWGFLIVGMRNNKKRIAVCWGRLSAFIIHSSILINWVLDVRGIEPRYTIALSLTQIKGMIEIMHEIVMITYIIFVICVKRVETIAICKSHKQIINYIFDNQIEKTNSMFII